MKKRSIFLLIKLFFSILIIFYHFFFLIIIIGYLLAEHWNALMTFDFSDHKLLFFIRFVWICSLVELQNFVFVGNMIKMSRMPFFNQNSEEVENLNFILTFFIPDTLKTFFADDWLKFNGYVIIYMDLYSIPNHLLIFWFSFERRKALMFGENGLDAFIYPFIFLFEIFQRIRIP